MKMGLQRSGDQVPASTMVPAAMNQKHEWSILIAPVRIMQPKALRLEEATFRNGHLSVLADKRTLRPAKKSEAGVSL
jgi:hypothetical protein